MCHECLSHGTFYEEYKLYGFADKDETKRRQYLTDALRDRICRRINGKRESRLIADKYRTYLLLKPYYRRHVWLLTDKTDLSSISSQGYTKLVAKPLSECGGRGVHLVSLDPSQFSITNSQFSTLKSKPFVLEELIIQSQWMAQWNPDSVNTIRMNTVLHNGTVTHFAPFILTGRKGHFVNNGLQGGLFASIDSQTGVIITNGADEQGIFYPAHPDSGITFKGTQVPRWDELLHITEEMALMLPTLTYVAWDMTLTEEGWICIEANKGEFVAQQTTLARGLRNEFEKLIYDKKEPNEDNSMKYLIAGLGNIGAEYEGTRHNCGFMVLDRLLKNCSSKDEKPTYVLERHAYRAEVKFKGRTLVLIRPTTYMNLSGKAVQYWLQKEHISLENLLVIVDDIALPVGKIRMKKQGSGGGHNGLANIEELLHSSSYARLRIGIGNDFGHGHQIDHVLGRFTDEELPLLEETLDRAAEAVKSFVTLGPDRTMNMFN